MILNSKGQVTVPAHFRAKYGLHPGDEVEVRKATNATNRSSTSPLMVGESSFYHLRRDKKGESDTKVVISDREMSKWSQSIRR